MASTKKKGGLGAESYFENIPTMDLSKEEVQEPVEAPEPSISNETSANDPIPDSDVKTPEEVPEAAQEALPAATEGECESTELPIDVLYPVDLKQNPETDEMTPDANQEAPELRTDDNRLESTPPSDAMRQPTSQANIEPPSPIVSDDTAERVAEPTQVKDADPEPDAEYEPPERLKIRRTYALYEETQIALEEMKLAARKQGIKTTLGDILEEAVLLLMEKKGISL